MVAKGSGVLDGPWSYSKADRRREEWTKHLNLLKAGIATATKQLLYLQSNFAGGQQVDRNGM